MKFKSENITAASGSIGGVTYSHNRGGMYRRARSIPVNPSTSAQQAVRNAMSTLMSRWRSTLDDTQRLLWKLYADNTPVTNVFGDSILLTGPQMYVRGNVPRIQAGLAIVDDGPTEFGLPEIGDLELTGIVAATATFAITYDNTVAWANQDDGHLLVYTSPPQSPTVNFFKGPYRFSGSVAGNGTTPPTSPALIVSPFPYASGQQGFARAIAVTEDGRVSGIFRGGIIAS